ncbi:MAG: MBL fold metallo-hydrolase [Pseudomonadota bacterium]
MELEFFGAAGEITGSCHILTVNGRRILLDCGLIQGGRRDERRNRDPFPFNPADIDAVVLSHAHIDHSGRLPLLIRRGFTGAIHTQKASRDLCAILLRDSASLNERDVARENRRRQRRGKRPLDPLYTAADADVAIKAMVGHRYKTAIDVVPGVTATFHDAGHIMGSSVVELDLKAGDKRRKIVFSGDIGQYDTPILRDPESLPRADLIVLESTYGGRRHRPRQETIDELGEIIRGSGKRSGNILIPAFAVGRSQELLYTLGKHYDEWDVGRYQIFLDSPMAIEASRIYWDYPHLYDDEATKLRREHDQMPPLPNLTLSKSPDQSRAINRLNGGAIVIAGSGMCNGGRILHHLKHNVWRPDAQVIIAGYQGSGSLGRRLVDGKATIKIHGETIRVAAKVHTVGGLSAHGDEDDLCRWYKPFRNRPPVFLVHGEKKSGRRLMARFKNDFGCQVTPARPGMRVNLDELRVHDPGVSLERN